MKAKIVWGVAIVAVVVAMAFWLFRKNTAGSEADIFSSVKRGAFKIEIETTGELEAKNSVKILGLFATARLPHLECSHTGYC